MGKSAIPVVTDIRSRFSSFLAQPGDFGVFATMVAMTARSRGSVANAGRRRVQLVVYGA